MVIVLVIVQGGICVCFAEAETLVRQRPNAPQHIADLCAADWFLFFCYMCVFMMKAPEVK